MPSAQAVQILQQLVLLLCWGATKCALVATLQMAVLWTTFSRCKLRYPLIDNAAGMLPTAVEDLIALVFVTKYNLSRTIYDFNWAQYHILVGLGFRPTRFHFLKKNV